MDGQYPGSKWMPTSHYWRGRSGRKLRWIILHGSASPKLTTAEAVARYYQETKRETSAHYIIGKDGEIVQCVAEEDSAWGNGALSKGHAPWWGIDGNPNFLTISIEHVRTDPLNNDSLTEPQRQASFALIAYLVKKWGIAPRWATENGGITGHFSIDPVGRWFCPGPYPYVELWNYLESPTNQPLATNPDSKVTPGMRASQFLGEVPGFYGLARGLDAAMQPEKLTDNSFKGVATWTSRNGLSLSTRFLFIMTGFLLLAILLYAVVRKNDWMGRAGYANVPALVMRTNTQAAKGGIT